MVYAFERRIKKEKGRDVLSTGQVLKQLGITKQTLYKWILLKKIKAVSHEIGQRVFLEFDPREVNRVKGKMRRERQPGKGLLSE